jgi:hypothetical protein
MVSGRVTSPCQSSAPSLERRAATAEEEVEGVVVDEEEEEVVVTAAVAFAVDVDAAPAAAFLTMALTRNLPLLTSSLTTWLPTCPVAPATTTSGRPAFFEEALFLLEGIEEKEFDG